MRSGRAATLTAAVAGFALSLLILSPGQYPFDAAYQLWQARTGAFNDTSPVAMTGLWALLLRVDPNPAVLLWVNLALLWTGLALCLAVAVRPLWLRLVALIVLGLAPLTLVEMAHLLSDAHFAALLTFATGLAAWGLAARRRGPLVAACAVLVYAACVRYNAPIAAVPFGGIAAQALVPAKARGWRAACGAAAALVLASALLGAGLDRTLAKERATLWPSLALWDLAAMSVASDTMLLPAFTRGPGLTADELVATGAFDPASNTLLYQKSRSGVRDGLGEAYSAAELRTLRRAWIASVLGHPGAYIRHRLRTTWLLIGPHRGPVHGVAYFEARSGYRDNPRLPQALVPAAQRRLYAIAASLTPTWWFSALPYLAASILALAAAARNDARGRVAIAAAASALAYTFPFVLLAPGAELRYLTWPIVAGPLALLLALASRRRRTQPAAWPARTVAATPR